MSKSSFFARFLPAIALSSAAPPQPTAGPPPKPEAKAADGLEKMVAELCADLDATRAENSAIKAAGMMFEAKANGLAESLSAAEKEVATLKTSLAAAETARDEYKAAAEKKEADIRQDVRNKELATLAASQGAPPSEVPGDVRQSQGDELESTLAAMRAEKDPVRKGILASRALKLREAA